MTHIMDASASIREGYKKYPEHIKEIYMDDSNFYSLNSAYYYYYSDLLLEQQQGRSSSSSSNNNNNPTSSKNYFLFQWCKSLERVSIRNAKADYRVVPQNALIKFVRNAPPSMRWFRSDLTEENMAMLRLDWNDRKLSYRIDFEIESRFFLGK